MIISGNFLKSEKMCPHGPHAGHGYYLNNLKSPTSKDDSCQIWLKSDHAFSRRRWYSYFYIEPPSPTCYPPQGPNGATLGTVMNNFYSSPKKVSTYNITTYNITTYNITTYYIHTYITTYCPTPGSGEEDVRNLYTFDPWGPPWAPVGATGTIWTTLNSLPIR